MSTENYPKHEKDSRFRNSFKYERNRKIYEAKKAGLSYTEIQTSPALNPDCLTTQRIQSITKNFESKEWRSTDPSLKQIESVIMVAKHRGEDLSFSEVKDNWSAGDCSDYIGSKGDGSLYNLRENNE